MKHYFNGKPMTKAEKIKAQVGMYMGTNVMPVKRKPRALETKPREQPERLLRNEVIKELRKKGWEVIRIENGIGGRRNRGVPDLWVFHEYKRIAGWIELKDIHGVLSLEQRIFQTYCKACYVNHWVIRTVEEALAI